MIPLVQFMTSIFHVFPNDFIPHLVKLLPLNGFLFNQQFTTFLTADDVEVTYYRYELLRFRQT